MVRITVLADHEMPERHRITPQNYFETTDAALATN
jgi:hypothetical protein